MSDNHRRDALIRKANYCDNASRKSVKLNGNKRGVNIEKVVWAAADGLPYGERNFTYE
jgi:hypothetical protein